MDPYLLFDLFKTYTHNNITDMVLKLDGNSEMGAHVRSHICNLTCSRQTLILILPAADMVLILDGNSEMGVHVRKNSLISNICSRDLIRSRAVTNRFFFTPSYFLRDAAKKVLFFSGGTTKRGGGKGWTTKNE